MADALNNTVVTSARVSDKERFNIHVSNAIESDGPRAFCPRYYVMAYHSTRLRTEGKITPARKLLFATGHFMGDYYISEVRKFSPYSGSIYANWSCSKWQQYVNDDEHTQIEDTLDNVSGKTCKCGRKLTKHNEVDLFLPKLRLTGHPDLLFLHNGVFYIHEAKSIDRKDIAFDDLRIPLPSHCLQVSFYYKMLKPKAKLMGARVSTNLRIDYIDRSMSKLFGGKPFKTLLTKPVDDRYLARFKNSIQHAVNGIATRKLPPRICEHSMCTRAKNCDMAVACFETRLAYITEEKRITGDRKSDDTTWRHI